MDRGSARDHPVAHPSWVPTAVVGGLLTIGLGIGYTTIHVSRT